MLGAAGTLRDLSAASSTDGAKAELLATIIDESERLNRFIANLLDMTKLESGAVAPNAALHDLRRDRRQRAASAPARSWPGTGSSSSLRRTCRCVELDAVLFEQVLFNLLDNAAKYAPPGTTIRIRGWRDGECGRACRSSTKATAFRRTISSASSTSSTARRRATRCAPAPASGLAISRGFVEAMHGTIAAANRTDRTGAVFTITLPVPAGADAAGHRRMSAAPIKVLVVDDEPPIRKLLRMGLEHAGLRDPRGAERQGRARRCSREKPDLVILDLGLPDIAGP